MNTFIICIGIFSVVAIILAFSICASASNYDDSLEDLDNENSQSKNDSNGDQN